MDKELKDLTFAELVEWSSQHIHSGLLESGGYGLKNAVRTALNMTCQWREEQDAKTAAIEAKRKKS